MLTKTELSKQDFIDKLKRFKEEITDEKGELYRLGKRQGVHLAICAAEQLPDTSELQAENEVLKLALELACVNVNCSKDKMHGLNCDGKGCSVCHTDEMPKYFIDQATRQIAEGMK